MIDELSIDLTSFPPIEWLTVRYRQADSLLFRVSSHNILQLPNYCLNLNSHYFRLFSWVSWFLLDILTFFHDCLMNASFLVFPIPSTFWLLHLMVKNQTVNFQYLLHKVPVITIFHNASSDDHVLIGPIQCRKDVRNPYKVSLLHLKSYL